MSRLEQLVID
jgi:hypothetical protein